MKRPLFSGMLFLVSGIISGRFILGQNAADIAFIVLFFMLVILANLYLYFSHKLARLILLFPALFVSSFILVQTNLSDKIEIENSELSVNNLEIIGIVDDTKTTSTGGVRVILNVSSIEGYGEKIPKDFKVMVYLLNIKEQDELPRISQVIKISGKLERLDRSRNPGAFDEFMYMRARKIQYKAFAELLQSGEIKLRFRAIQQKPCTELLQSGEIKLRFRNYTDLFKNKLANIYDTILPEREAGILKSMVLGDRNGLDDYISEIYRSAGIFHILAVSGLHTSVLGIFIGILVTRTLGRRYSGALTVCFLIVYCIFTGCGISTVRASLMCSVVIIGQFFRRGSDLPTSAALAAIILLLYEPLYLYDIGFQYSFAAVFGIAFMSSPIIGMLESLSEKSKWMSFLLDRKYIRQFLPATIAASIATTPIVGFHFYYFTTYTIIVNLIIVPSVCIVLVSGVIVGFVGLLSVDMAAVLSGVVFVMLKLYEIVCVFFVKLPFSVILTGRLPFASYVLYYSVIIFTLLIFKNKSKFLQKRKFLLVVCICAASMFVSCGIDLFSPKLLEITMLDVGQGDCFVISKDDKAYVIDGGGHMMIDFGENTGEKVLKPFLDFKGIRRLDGVFISHFDADHSIGILEILDDKKVENIFIHKLQDGEMQKIARGNNDNEWSNKKIYEKLQLLAGKYNIPITELGYDDYVSSGDIKIECLAPIDGIKYSDANNSSLVLRLNYLSASILFTGDIDSKTERQILSEGVKCESDVLKLAHHGSKYSNCNEFVNAVSPKLALVSTGRNNMYGHPSQQIKQYLGDNEIPLYDTSYYGAVILETDGNKIYIK